MKTASRWIVFAIVLVALYLADMKHLPSTYFNIFLLILMGLVTGLIIFLKKTHQSSGQEDQDPKG